MEKKGIYLQLQTKIHLIYGQQTKKSFHRNACKTFSMEKEFVDGIHEFLYFYS